MKYKLIAVATAFWLLSITAFTVLTLGVMGA